MNLSMPPETSFSSICEEQSEWEVLSLISWQWVYINAYIGNRGMAAELICISVESEGC